MPSYQHRDPDVKDKTVSPTVLSLTWEAPYLRKTVFLLRRGPEIWNPLPSRWISKILVMTFINLILNPRQKSRCPAQCAVVSLFYTLWYKYVSAWLNWSSENMNSTEVVKIWTQAYSWFTSEPVTFLKCRMHSDGKFPLAGVLCGLCYVLSTNEYVDIELNMTLIVLCSIFIPFITYVLIQTNAFFSIAGTGFLIGIK